MAKLGVRTFDELVGHSDWLRHQGRYRTLEGSKGLDFSKVFHSPVKMPARRGAASVRDADHGLDRRSITSCQGAQTRRRRKRVEVPGPRSATANCSAARCCPTPSP